MKTIWLCLLIVVSLGWCAAQESEKAPLGPTLAIEKDGGTFACGISAQAHEWHAPPVEISLVVENRSKSALDVAVVPHFVLKPSVPAKESFEDEFSYVALWDSGNKATLPVSSTVSLRLKPGESRKITQDVSILFWSRLISSVIAHSRLFEAVPPGKYKLQLRVNARDDRVLCSSNELNIFVGAATESQNAPEKRGSATRPRYAGPNHLQQGEGAKSSDAAFDLLKQLTDSLSGSITLNQKRRILEFCPDNTCDGFVASGIVPLSTLKDFAYLYIYFFSDYIYLPEWRKHPEAKNAAELVLSKPEYRSCTSDSGLEAARCSLLHLSRNGRIELLFIRYDEGQRSVVRENVTEKLSEKKPEPN